MLRRTVVIEAAQRRSCALTYINCNIAMVGLYFSGTGNTKHCVEKFVQGVNPKNQAYSIETPDLDKLLGDDPIIVLGHPVHFSNVPKMVGDFIRSNAALFHRKEVFIIATMGLFSGDGAGCSARVLRRCGAEIIGGLHLKMPDCISDVKLLKRPLEKNRQLIEQADKKIELASKRFTEGKYFREGLNIFYRIAGLLGQRLWFYGKTTSYKDKPDVDLKKCTRCGSCIKSCPMKNLEKSNEDIIHHNRCAMCYRCVNSCPAQALTILGKKIYEQGLFQKYGVGQIGE